MIAPDVQILDIDMAQLARFAELVFERRSQRPPAGRSGHLLLLVERGEVVKSYHSERGVLSSVHDPGPKSLRQLAERTRAAQVTRIERGALERIVERFQREVDFEADYLSQLFCALSAVKPEIGKTVHGWPENFRGLKFASERVARAGLRRVPTRGPLVYVAFDFDAQEVFLSGIFRFEKREGRDPELTLWTHTDRLLADRPPLHDLKTAAEMVSERLEREFGAAPVHGAYFTRAGMEELLSSKKPLSTLAQLESRGEAHLSPWPIALRLLSVLGRLLGF